LLNRAARFFPILRELKAHLADGDSLLEVGSGYLGVGEFWRGSFVGCDVAFSLPPVKNMRAVRCSGLALPFRNSAFDAVVVSDVIEHVPTDARKPFITEVLRVARKRVVFGYPCGKAAFALDRKLYEDYKCRNLPAPLWLEEHMLRVFPDEHLLDDLIGGWRKKGRPNESLAFHYWMMKAERLRFWDYLFRAALLIAPGTVERLLRYADYEPAYRKIFVLTRCSEDAHV